MSKRGAMPFGTVVAPVEHHEAAPVRTTRVDVTWPRLPLAAFRDVRVIRSVVAVAALVLGAYCLMAAATALYAQPAPGNPDPQELAARERHRWPGWIPVLFLVIVVGYAITVAARRRGSRGRSSPPSTQGPPPIDPRPTDRHRDTTSR